MKSRHALLAAACFLSLTGVSVCLGGNRPQPTAPPIPPSWKQPPAPAPQKPAPTTTVKPAKDSRSPDQANRDEKARRDAERAEREREMLNNNPYGYGQPVAGVYSPGSGMSSSSGNPNGIPQNNPNATPDNGQGLFNNAPAPAADKPAPTPVTVAPPTPPDPEIVQATADVNAAMDKLRDGLLKSNTDYQAAVAEKKVAQADSATVHAREDSTQEQIVAAATRVLEASRKVVQIERDAAVTDQGVQDAQSKLKTAIAAHAANAAATASAK